MPRDGFKTIYRAPNQGRTFAELVDAIASALPNLRIRFTSPHPKDFPQQLVRMLQKHANVGAMLHVPAQSGSSTVLVTEIFRFVFRFNSTFKK